MFVKCRGAADADMLWSFRADKCLNKNSIAAVAAFWPDYQVSKNFLIATHDAVSMFRLPNNYKHFQNSVFSSSKE